MKALIINASPRPNGLISQMLRRIQQDAEARGIPVESVNANELSIKPCIGCMVCRSKGKCILAEDDSQCVLRQMQNADIIIIGAPCYWGNMPGQLKLLFDRIVYGLIQTTSLPPQPLMKGKKAALISTCTTPWPFNFLFNQSRGTIRTLRQIMRSAGIKITHTIQRGNTHKLPMLTEKDIRKCARIAASLQFNKPLS